MSDDDCPFPTFTINDALCPFCREFIAMEHHHKLDDGSFCCLLDPEQRGPTPPGWGGLDA